MKSPAINFYTSDFLTGVAFMSNEQIGVYIKLLCYQHQLGHLSKNQVFSITKDELVLSKFKVDKNGLYFNERMEEEITKKNKYVESRRNNRNKVDNSNTCIYLIKNEKNGLVKIGSSNNPERRLVELKRQYGNELKILAFVKGKKQSLEKKLQEEFKNKNEFNEWFSLSNKEIEEIIMNNHMITDVYNHMENEIEIENKIENISKNNKEIDIIKKIVEYLNKKTNSNYKYTTKTTQEKIKARLNEGFNLNDFIVVIDKKTEEWIDDPKMSKYLRPETLFGNKFESYLNQLIVSKKTLKDISMSEIDKLIELEERNEFYDKDKVS